MFLIETYVYMLSLINIYIQIVKKDSMLQFSLKRGGHFFNASFLLNRFTAEIHMAVKLFIHFYFA